MSRFDEFPPEETGDQPVLSVEDQINQEVFGGRQFADLKAEATDTGDYNQPAPEDSPYNAEAGEEVRTRTIRERVGALAIRARGAWENFEETHPETAGRIRTVGGATAETALVFGGEAAKTAIAVKSPLAAKAAGVWIDRKVEEVSKANHEAAEQRGHGELRDEAVARAREQAKLAAQMAADYKKAA